jgi:hypothetical protein
MEVTTLSGLLGVSQFILLLTLAKMAYAFGKLSNTLENLMLRTKEDRTEQDAIRNNVAALHTRVGKIETKCEMNNK